jgi:hypothetical protein
MRRRSLLATVAAGVTGLPGCMGLNPGSTATESPTPTSTPTEDDNEQQEPQESKASVIELETQPHTLALSPNRLITYENAKVTLQFDRTATSDHPARITGSLENMNDYETPFQIEWIPVVGRTHARRPQGQHRDATLYAVPTENNEIATEVPAVSQTAEGNWIVEDVGAWMPDVHRLDPGERIHLEYVITGGPDMEGLPTGPYEFSGGDEFVDLTVWETDSPGPDTESRFTGRSVPTLPQPQSIQWYHEADATTGAYVEPSSERIELDGLVEFQVINHTDVTLQCGHWNMYKLVDGEWYHIGPFGHDADCRSLLPGRTKEWALRAFKEQAVRCASSCGVGGFTRGFLGGGEYAMVAGYGHPEGTSGALFELVGAPAVFTVTDDARIQRDGDTVTVTTNRYGDGEHPPDASFSLTRVDSADERVIPEQLSAGNDQGSAREQGLRNALAVMDDDVDRIIVRGDEYVVDRTLGHNAETRRFKLRGQAYQAERLSNNQ